MFRTLDVDTNQWNELVDITKRISEIIIESGIQNGLMILFVPHTTAAVTINENADPTVPIDMINSLKKISPNLSEFRHLEGNSDAHVKSSLVGCSQEIIIADGQPVLGTWQGIFFCEFDGPRHRKIYLKLCEC